MSDDNELNPDPERTSWESFSIFNWNLNNIPAYNCVKISLLQAYISITKIDMLYLSETYDDDLIPCNDFDVDVSGYTRDRSDHPSNGKRGGVCICCKGCLRLNVTEIHYLQE